MATLFGSKKLERFPDHEHLRLTPSVFEVLRLGASDGLNRNAPEADPAVLRRICNNCDSIKVVLKKRDAIAAWLDVPKERVGATGPFGTTRQQLVAERDALIEPWFKVLPGDALIVRHAWEVSTEVVRAQTVVQLRGDIVTRLHPQASDAVRAMHQLGVGSALGHWQHLMGLVMQIGRDALGYFAGRGR